MGMRVWLDFIHRRFARGAGCLSRSKKFLEKRENPLRKAILLDWDGVLCNSLELCYEFYKVNCERFKHALPIHDVDQFRAWYNPEWQENFYEMGFTREEFALVSKDWEDSLQYSRAGFFEDVKENLERWSRDYSLAIVSTTPSWMIRDRLAQDGLEGFFQVFTGGEDGIMQKRDKVKNTLDLLEAIEGVLVGDTPLDIDAGAFHGLKTIGVTYGWVTPERIRAANPTRIVEEPSDLYQAVLDLIQS